MYRTDDAAVTSAARKSPEKQAEFLAHEVREFRGRAEGITWADVEAWRADLEQRLVAASQDMIDLLNAGIREANDAFDRPPPSGVQIEQAGVSQQEPVTSNVEHTVAVKPKRERKPRV